MFEEDKIMIVWPAYRLPMETV